MFNQDDSFFGNYGVESGYNQTAPGRDVAKPRVAGQPGRPRTNPVVQNAIAAQPPVAQQPPQAQPFKGAQQTIGAQPQGMADAIMGGNQMQTQGGPASDPRWTNGTWGRGPVQAPPLQAPAPAPAPSTIPDYSGWGQYGVQGLDQNKVANNHDSPKYQLARLQSHFDPRQGVTPEFLAAANQLGIGTFTGHDDKLFVGGNVDPRFGNVLNSDINIGFKTGNGQWGAWGSEIGGGAPQQGHLSAATPFLDPSVMSNAIMSSGVPQSGDYTSRILQQIQAALSGGRL